MNKTIINLNIDVTKIDKSALYKGAKGTYLNISLFLDESGQPDQYNNNGFMVQDLGKERRENGEKGAVLGNARYVKRDNQQSPAPRPSSAPAEAYDEDDDIPF